ncbi:hypothetical protein GCM10010495_33510 [Kitasatospora herbaricolor]|uniref:hypothetical protein n=1 Tax=Kitasatospora herbaricolor TaxID=68217 RepID=UPI00174D1A98|nr:hypothetical protein [Kitasatospora herbaricolor]MDQ0307583.1 hypothetical protein [Kitasatospora herbaricolor]GGV16492.1 hypothetical protein GCM10010495_33510 [Kitasatospora herbaricolor]
MPQNEPAAALDRISASIRLRSDPAAVARLVRELLPGLSPAEAARLEGAGRRTWAVAPAPAAPAGAGRQLAVAGALFGSVGGTVPAGGAEQVARAVRFGGREIGRPPGAADFRERLNREARAAAGLGGLSKRQYNKRFRLLRRLEAKQEVLELAERERRAAALAETGLLSLLDAARPTGDLATACLIAFQAARRHCDPDVTGWLSRRAGHRVTELLLARAAASPGTDWWALAHVHPVREVVTRLTEHQRGLLAGRWSAGLRETAALLERAHGRCSIEPTAMFARPGDDAYAWNLAARAWNAARVQYLEVLEALGAQEVLGRVCPGQVAWLDVIEPESWRRWVSDRKFREIEVWAGLPLPWQVLAGTEDCPAELVERVCRRHGVDPVRTGWTTGRARWAAPAGRLTAAFVDGVAEADPVLARVLRARA